METIIISKTQTLLIDHDRIVYKRSDVLNEALREQHFLFEDLRRVVYVPLRINWFAAIFLFVIGILLDTLQLEFEKGAINLFFVNRTSRYIDCGELKVRERRKIVLRINRARRKWQRREIISKQ